MGDREKPARLVKIRSPHDGCDDPRIETAINQHEALCARVAKYLKRWVDTDAGYLEAAENIVSMVYALQNDEEFEP